MNILRKAWHRFWIKRWPSAYHSETLTRISAEDTDIANLTLKTVRARLSEKQVNTLIQHCDLPNADVISLFHSVTDKVPFLIALSDQSLHLLLNDSDTIQDLPLDDIVIALSTRTQKFINDVWKKLGNFFRGKNGVITCHNTQHNDIIKRVLLVGGVETLSFWAKSYPRHKLLKDQFVQERVTDVLIDQEHFFYEMLKSDALPSISSLTLQKILETHYSNGVPKPVIETLIAMAKANADHARVIIKFIDDIDAQFAIANQYMGSELQKAIYAQIKAHYTEVMKQVSGVEKNINNPIVLALFTEQELALPRERLQKLFDLQEFMSKRPQQSPSRCGSSLFASSREDLIPNNTTTVLTHQ